MEIIKIYRISIYNLLHPYIFMYIPYITIIYKFLSTIWSTEMVSVKISFIEHNA